MKTALTGDRLQLRRVKKSPEQLTRIRKKAEKQLGHTIKPSVAEIDSYARAGKTPPTV
ncbi:MAG TPA: hypothetical protein VIW24_27455 [Aldersonia sp.]